MLKTMFAINAIILHDFYCQKVADGLVDESQNSFTKRHHSCKGIRPRRLGRNNSIVRAGNHVAFA